MKNNYFITALVIAILAITGVFIVFKVHQAHSQEQIPIVYQGYVKTGILSPSAARSLAPNAPLLNAMNAYVAQVSAAKERIDKLPISKNEKMRLIHSEMRKASSSWRMKFTQQDTYPH